MGNSFEILSHKLDLFIRKYYINRLLKGLIVGILLLSIYSLSIITLEYFNYYSVAVRKVLFLTTIFIFISVILYFIVIPILQLFKLAKGIGYKEASILISKFFPEVNDKLLNTIELKESASNNNNELLLASINQRIELLNPFKFSSAIKFNTNVRFAKFLLIPILLGTILYISFPNFYKDSSERIINYNIRYEKKLPFDFNVTYENKVIKGDDLTIKVNLSGSFVPENVLIEFNGNKYFMKKEANTRYSYTISSVLSNFEFNLVSGEYSSELYSVNVIPIPQVLDFDIEILPPSYTKIEKYQQNSIGDLSIPEGSIVSWNFNTVDVGKLHVIYDGDTLNTVKKGNKFAVKKAIHKSGNYSVCLTNDYFNDTNYVSYTIGVQKDNFPTISVSSTYDTLSSFVQYFKIKIADDYGITACKAEIQLNDSLVSVPLDIAGASTNQQVFYSINFSEFKNYDSVKYYFTVTDNDELHGYKTTKSTANLFKKPTIKELNTLEDSVNTKLNNKVNSGLHLAEELKQDIEDLKRKLLNDNVSDWERQNLIKDLQSSHKQLDEIKKNIKKEFDKLNKLSETVSEKDKALLEKQKQIEELLESIMDDEFKELMAELEKLSKDFNKEEFFELSEEMEMNYENFEKQLDRNLEMLKRFEIESKMNKTINELKDLSKKQMDLSEEIKNTNKNELENLEDKLEKQKENFNEIAEDYENTLEKNNSLENQFNLDDFKEEMKNIQEQFEKSGNDIKQGKKGESSKGSQKNSENLQKMANEMQQMMNSNALSQAMENIEDLRQILDNLLTYSFDQENLLSETSNLRRQDPRYPQLANKQINLKENFAVIEDSLYALASRVPQINNIITKELLNGKKNIQLSFTSLEELRHRDSKVAQQYTITAVNNLALLLDEILQKMQEQAQQMMQQMGGGQQCNNPKNSGQGMPSLSQMRGAQESLKSQMEQMIKQMKENGGKPGGKEGMSQKLSQMLSQQEMYNKMLNDLMDKGSYSKETMQKLNEIKRMMDKNEDDIIDRKISETTLFRQNQIITRLLESEQAERKRELDEKRESNENKEELVSNPAEYFKYKQADDLLDNILEYSNVKLNKFYKKKYDDFIINLNNIR